MTKKTILDYQRQQEILFDIAMDLGSSWHKIDLKTRETLMDQLNGSRGLFDMVVQWVEEFDREWEASADDANKQYLESVNEFATNKITEMVQSARGNLGSAKVEKTRKTYLDRYDEHARKISVLEGLRMTLSPKELGWLLLSRNRILTEVDLKKVSHLTHCCGVLAAKKIYDLRQSGFTFMALSSALDLSASRTSILSRHYEAELHMKDQRAANGRETNMPWAE